MRGQRICDPSPLYIKAQGPRRGETLSRTILSSASQNLERKNGTPSKAAPRALPEERASTVGRARGYSVGAVQRKAITSALNALTNVLAALMGKGPLNSMATKNKGNAVITAIKYSAPDRAMLFSFYNHPQPLWAWADRTSINPIKLNLHVDIQERGKASIKGGGSSPERERGTRAKNRCHPGRAKEKVFLDKHSSPLCNHLEYHD